MEKQGSACAGVEETGMLVDKDVSTRLQKLRRRGAKKVEFVAREECTRPAGEEDNNVADEGVSGKDVKMDIEWPRLEDIDVDAVMAEDAVWDSYTTEKTNGNEYHREPLSSAAVNDSSSDSCDSKRDDIRSRVKKVLKKKAQQRSCKSVSNHVDHSHEEEEAVDKKYPLRRRNLNSPQIETMQLAGDTPKIVKIQSVPELQMKNSHERQQIGMGAHRCKYCAQTFSCLRDKKRHERTHTAKKLFFCSYCDRVFAGASSWKIHERSHTGEKPYSCRYCPKAFSGSSTRQAHERIHTGEKLFSCRFCSKSFTQISTRDKHVSTHTREKRFACTFCSKTLSRRDSLREHERAHLRKLQQL